MPVRSTRLPSEQEHLDLSHDWFLLPGIAHRRCRACGAYAHLSSGIMPCPAALPALVQDAARPSWHCTVCNLVEVPSGELIATPRCPQCAEPMKVGLLPVNEPPTIESVHRMLQGLWEYTIAQTRRDAFRDRDREATAEKEIVDLADALAGIAVRIDAALAPGSWHVTQPQVEAKLLTLLREAAETARRALD